MVFYFIENVNMKSVVDLLLEIITLHMDFYTKERFLTNVNESINTNANLRNL